MRFMIFTHVLHKDHAGKYSAYAPYVREMNLWLRQVDSVEIVAPINELTKGNSRITSNVERNVAESYRHSHISFTRIPSFHLLNLTGALQAVFQIPIIISKIVIAIRRADHLHLRCPGNVGLLACICQIFFPGKTKSAKYAGNWDPKAAQPWTYKLQKWILSNTFLTRNMQVLVYGDWPGQTRNIKPFFTASFSEQEIFTFRGKNFDGPLTFLFVGNLVPGKHPLKAVQLVQEMKDYMSQSSLAPEISLEIYGYGPEQKMLQAYCRNEKLEGLVKFKGSRPLEELKEAYQNAHFVILPSQSEGWPKAIAEGMFFGCIPIATAVSCVPWMLNYGSRGILIPDLEKRVEKREKRNGFERGEGKVDCQDTLRKEDRGQRKEDMNREENQDILEETVEKIIELLNEAEEMRRMSMEAQEWSQQYTLEKFEEAIKEILAPQPKGEQKRKP